MIEKKNSSPTQPGSHSAGHSRTSMKPNNSIQRLILKCKRLRWIGLALLLSCLLFAVWILTLAFKPEAPPEAAAPVVISSSPTIPTPTTEPTPAAEKTVQLFTMAGTPVDMQEATAAWAMEAGIEQRYVITDAERYELAQIVTGEAQGEPFAGKVAVAQCILQASEDDDLRPLEAAKKYKYTPARPEPTTEALSAVSAVFDFGYIATAEPIKYFYAPAITPSSWHESQVYVMTINNHKFFKEVRK